MKAIKYIFPFFFLLSFSGGTYAQLVDSAQGDKLFFQTDFYAGNLLDIHPDFPENKISTLYEAGISFQTLGKRGWHQDIGFPEVGIAFSYASFGNAEVLGKSIALIPNISFRDQMMDKNLNFEMRFGAGLAWFSKPYDFKGNPENLVIGSRYSVIVNISGGVHYKLSQKFSIRLGAALIHYSNGHTAVPNIGANIISGYLGLKYYPDRQSEFTRSATVMPSQKLRFTLRAGVGFHEQEGTVSAPNGPMYTVYCLSPYLTKRFSRIHNGHIGLHFHYYTAFHALIINEDVFESNYKINSSNIVFFIGDEIMMGRLSFVAQIGYNIFHPFKERMIELGFSSSKWMDFRITGKFGIQYYPLYQIDETRKKFYIGIYLKSIAGKADFAETAIGYTF